MNTKTFLLVAALCGTTPFVPLFAQGGGGSGGGSGSSGGNAGSGSGSSTGSNSGASSSSTAAPSSSSTSGASTASGTTATPGAPNTSSSLPSRSVLNTESPGNPSNARAANPGNLPPGLSVAPATPGVSPVSGIPVSNLPTVSPGTEPLGPNAKVPPATSSVAESEANTHRRNPAATTTTEPGSVAPQPQTNTLIEQGTTTVVPTPPPAVPTEVTPRSVPNESGMVWIDGHYSWLGGQWSWVNGTWQRPPSDGARWIPGSYDAQNKRWTEGHWERGANPAPRARETNAPQR